MTRLVAALVPLLVFCSAEIPALALTGEDPPARPRSAGVKGGEPTGRLALYVTPPAAVVIDGDAVGTTPLGGAVRLAPGRHVVEVRRPGFEPITREVEIVADQETALEVNLADGPSGTLRLYVAPWATVAVDGEACGATPLRALTLPPGSHVVRLTHPHYPPQTRTVEVVAGEEAALEVDMADGEPEPGEAGPEAMDPVIRKEVEDPDPAVGQLRSACRAGSARGCLRLGLAYQQGRGVAKDEGRAAGLFKTACDRGEALGCAMLASAYWLGRGVPEDRGRAIGYFEQACAGGVRSACEEP